MHDPVDSNGGYILFTERALYRQKIRSEFKAKYGSREITCKCFSPTIKKSAALHQNNKGMLCFPFQGFCEHKTNLNMIKI